VAAEFGLNYAQMRFVQDAVPGNEDAGFAEALIGVDGEWRGIQVTAMPNEKRVIDFDPATQELASLPGAGDTIESERAAFHTAPTHRAPNK